MIIVIIVIHNQQSNGHGQSDFPVSVLTGDVTYNNTYANNLRKNETMRILAIANNQTSELAWLTQP